MKNLALLRPHATDIIEYFVFPILPGICLLLTRDQFIDIQSVKPGSG
jgi:hypothetical protein